MNIVKRPQFLFTYYNPFDSHKDNLGNTFLDYVKDVNLANYSSQVVGKFIEQQTEEQLSAINNLSTELSMIGEDIRYGFNKINQRLTLIQVEQFNTNLLLKDIRHILKQPDSEKQRMKHIELGVKFFNQALKNEDLIIDAVEEFDKAFALMKQDWFTAYQLGLCHTYYNAVQDLSKAEAYFLSAAKYASVDTLVVNDFNEAFYKSISLTENENNNLLDFAAECYLQVALIKYIQADFVGAATYAKKATSLSSNNAKAFFLLAKYESRIGKYESAIESLKIANNLDNNIYKVFPNDIDILKNSLFPIFYSKTKENNLQKEEQKEKELTGNILWIILENQIQVRVRNYFLDYGLERQRLLEYSISIRQILKEQEKQISNYYSFRYNYTMSSSNKEKIKTNTINTLISIFYNNQQVLNFVKSAKAELDRYYIENYEENQKNDDDTRKRCLELHHRDVGMSKAPLSLDDAIKKDYYGLGSKIDDLYWKSVLRLNLFDIYNEELKKHNLLDKIKILGDTPQQKNICQLHFDCFLTGKSLSTLPSPQELEKVEREKSWWEKMFG